MNNQEYKADGGKLRVDLVSPAFIEAVASIRTYGVKKYGDSENWRKVEPERYVAAAMRHFEAYRKGESHDSESEFPHLWHCACNLMFLIDMEVEKARAEEEIGNKTNYELMKILNLEHMTDIITHISAELTNSFIKGLGCTEEIPETVKADYRDFIKRVLESGGGNDTKRGIKGYL